MLWHRGNKTHAKILMNGNAFLRATLSLWILDDEVQQLSAVNHFRLLCRPFQIIYYMQSQPEFRRNWARCDVRRDVWEQKGIPLSLPATRARRL